MYGSVTFFRFGVGEKRPTPIELKGRGVVI
jgi:hypothetical protein